jgi:hypothetical protein
MAPVAFGTTKHDEAALSPAKLPQGLSAAVAPHWRFRRPGGAGICLVQPVVLSGKEIGFF